MATIAFSAIPRANAEVSVDFFYNNLDGGNWYETPDYGYVWQPSAATSTSWRPYSDGYWAYTDVGWTWVSYEDHGWATCHYGRWTRISNRGWCWVPGTDWGGAWVSWRTGGDYVGWAPLPPVRGEMVYDGRPITGYVDVDYDIGPAYYNFIDVRYIGEPVLRSHIYDYNQNITYINSTVNVTNITYNDNRVYNYGPDYAVMSKYSVKPIQKLQIQQQANFDPSVGVKGSAMTKVQGNQLLVSAPMKLQKSEGGAPKQIKEKLSQPKYETGWAGVTDPGVKQKLVQKFKSESSKNVPPPDIQPKGGTNAATETAAPGAAAAPNAGGNAASGAMPGKGKGKHDKDMKHAEAAMPSPGPSVGSDAVSGTNAPTDANVGGKGKGNKHSRAERMSASTPPDTSVAPNGTAPVAPQTTEPGGKHKGQRMQDTAAPGKPTGEMPPTDDQGRGGKRKNKQMEPPQGPPQPGGGDDRGPGRGGKHREETAVNPGGAPPPPPDRPGDDRGGKHRKDKGEPVPVASPTP